MHLLCNYHSLVGIKLLLVIHIFLKFYNASPITNTSLVEPLGTKKYVEYKTSFKEHMRLLSCAIQSIANIARVCINVLYALNGLFAKAAK